MSLTPEQHLRALQQDVEARSEGRCRILAVSKTKPASDLRRLAGLGQFDFGENYVQEAIGKQHELADLPLTWHLIGPLQTNKAKLVAQHFAYVHSVDRLRLIEALQQHRAVQLPRLKVFIQVNIDQEPSKSGCYPAQVPELVRALAGCDRLQLVGLMCIPRPGAEPEKSRPAFARLRALQQLASKSSPDCVGLSMGMSDDYAIAIAEGATWVRIGSLLFGAR